MTDKENDIRDALEARARFRREGNIPRSDFEVQRMRDIRRRLALRNVPLASAVLVYDARQALARKDPGRAVVLLNAAADLSPDLASLHWMRLKASFTYDPSNVSEHLSIAADGLLGHLRGFRNQLSLASDFLAVLGLSLILLTLLYAGVQSLKYLRYVAYDVARWLPQWFSPVHALFLVALVWLAPLALGGGVLVAVAFWLAALLVYQERYERILGVACLVLLAALPASVYLAAPLITFHGSHLDILATVASESFCDEEEAELIRGVDSAGTVDYESAFALAERARVRADLIGAMGWYRKALLRRPGDEAATNNLGVVTYLSRDPHGAEALFREATQGGVGARAWLNLASVLLEKARFEEAQAALDTARSRSRELAAQYGDLSPDTSTGERLVTVPFQDVDMWDRLVQEEDGRVALTEHFWGFVGSRLPPTAMPVVALVLMALGLLVHRRRGRLALCSPCVKCGRPAPPESADRMCDQCDTVFLHTDAIEPGRRKKKERSVHRFQGRRTTYMRVLSMVAGLSDLYDGQPLVGALLNLVLLFSIVAILWLEHFTVNAWTLAPGAPTVLVAIFVALGGVVTAVSVKRSFN